MRGKGTLGDGIGSGQGTDEARRLGLDATIVTTKNATHRSGSLTRTQIVWLAFLGSMTSFGAFFAFTSPTPMVAPSAAIIEDSASFDDTGIRQGVEPAGWLNIVVHESGLHFEDHEDIDRRHRAEGLNGNGYHYVIGNGTGRLADGAIVATSRWAEQRSGAHVAANLRGGSEALAKADELNRTSIGVCLIGDGDERAFTHAQIKSLRSLVVQLQSQFGIDDDHVVLHRDVSDVDAPGRYFPSAEFDRFLTASRP